MPRYYRFGYQPPRYESQWNGRPPAASSPAATTRGLGDVTDGSQFFDVPAADDPYILHKQNYQRAPQFFVPKRDDPYWLHKHAMGSFAPSRMEKQAIVVIGAGIAAYFLAIRKGSPLRKRMRRRR